MLTGKSIAKVLYIELNNPDKDYQKGKYHTIDFGIQFLLDDDSVVHFGWDTTKEHFEWRSGNLIIPPHLREKKFRIWEVQGDLAWVPFIGKKIKDVMIETIDRIWENGNTIQSPIATTLQFEKINAVVNLNLAEPVYHDLPIDGLTPYFQGHIWISFI